MRFKYAATVALSHGDTGKHQKKLKRIETFIDQYD